MDRQRRAPSRMLGRYALYDKIASGGMASVHIGRLVGPVGFARTVAIKRMHAQLAEDPEFVSMFLDEARLASRIQHPNVVQTLDVVALSGELFLVMDYVQGESLARLLRTAAALGETLPLAMAVAIVVGILHGLHAAHEATNERGEQLSIVHRDVTPQNVLVGTDGVARVLDFGIAKASGRLQTTRDGQLKGKIAYMSPEQLRGEATRRTDVYAASVVLWEALAGRRLFRGDSDGEVFGYVSQGCREPPSQYAPVPAAVDAITMRGLSVDPTARYTTANEMARALEDAVSLAPASRIGDWVARMAKDKLDERTGVLRDVESDSALFATPGQRSGVLMASERDERALAMASGSSPYKEGLTQVTTTAVTSPTGGKRLIAGDRRLWLGGGVVVLAGLSFLGLRAVSGAKSAASSAPPEMAIPVAPTVQTQPSASAPASSPAASLASPPPDPSPVASSSPAPGAPTRRSPPVVPRAGKQAAPQSSGMFRFSQPD